MKLLRAAKRAFRYTPHASLDVDLRYKPVVRFLQRLGPEATLLEVGSGYLGVAPYVRRTVIGVDADFPSEPMSNLIPVVSKGVLPFRDRTFDVVISLDTLEHVPREYRQLFWNELIRTAKWHVVIGFPEGSAAERHDNAMERYYTQQHGAAHPYFVEHRIHRIPRSDEVEAYLLQAEKDTRRHFSVYRVKNVNIKLRTLFMRLIWHRNRYMQGLYFLLTPLSRSDRLFHFGRCYRSVYFLALDDTG